MDAIRTVSAKNGRAQEKVSEYEKPAKDVSYQSCRWHVERVCLTKDLSKLFVLAHVCEFRVFVYRFCTETTPSWVQSCRRKRCKSMVCMAVAEQHKAVESRHRHCSLLIADCCDRVVDRKGAQDARSCKLTLKVALTCGYEVQAKEKLCDCRLALPNTQANTNIQPLTCCVMLCCFNYSS